MAVSTYNPDQVSIVFNGILITGFADGAFLSVERNEDSYSLQIGTDGEACRSKSNNKSGRVTVTLLQSSMANGLLAALHNLDEASPDGAGIGSLLIKDNSGLSIYAAEKAWIVKPPAAGYDREAGSREWVIETDHLVQFDGGNT